MDGQSDRETSSSLHKNRTQESIRGFQKEFEVVRKRPEDEFCLESPDAFDVNFKESSEDYHFDFNDPNSNDLVLDMLLWENYYEEDKKENEMASTRSSFGESPPLLDKFIDSNPGISVGEDASSPNQDRSCPMERTKYKRHQTTIEEFDSSTVMMSVADNIFIAPPRRQKDNDIETSTVFTGSSCARQVFQKTFATDAVSQPEVVKRGRGRPRKLPYVAKIIFNATGKSHDKPAKKRRRQSKDKKVDPMKHWVIKNMLNKRAPDPIPIVSEKIRTDNVHFNILNPSYRDFNSLDRFCLPSLPETHQRVSTAFKFVSPPKLSLGLRSDLLGHKPAESGQLDVVEPTVPLFEFYNPSMVQKLIMHGLSNELLCNEQFNCEKRLLLWDKTRAELDCFLNLVLIPEAFDVIVNGEKSIVKLKLEHFRTQIARTDKLLMKLVSPALKKIYHTFIQVKDINTSFNSRKWTKRKEINNMIYTEYFGVKPTGDEANQLFTIKNGVSKVWLTIASGGSQPNGRFLMEVISHIESDSYFEIYSKKISSMLKRRYDIPLANDAEPEDPDDSDDEKDTGKKGQKIPLCRSHFEAGRAKTLLKLRKHAVEYGFLTKSGKKDG